MFENSKFEKTIQNNDASTITVFLGENADKKRIKGCEKLFSRLFGNFKTVVVENQTQVKTASFENAITLTMGEIMDYFVEIKVGETIKFAVNDETYEI